MMDWLDPLSSALGFIAAASALIGIVWRPMRHILAALRAINGEPERPGVLQEVREQREAIEWIRAQLQPDHGTTVRDALSRVESRSVEANTLAHATSERVQTLAERLDAHIERKTE